MADFKCSVCGGTRIRYPDTDVYICPACDQVVNCTQDHSGNDKKKAAPAHNHTLPRIFEAEA